MLLAALLGAARTAWAQADVQIQIGRPAQESGYDVRLMGQIPSAGRLDPEEEKLRVLVRTNSVPAPNRDVVFEIAGMAYRTLKEAGDGLRSTKPVAEQKEHGKARVEELLRARRIPWVVSATGKTRVEAYNLEFVEGNLGLPTGIRVVLKNLDEGPERSAAEARLLRVLVGGSQPDGAFVPPALDEAEIRRKLVDERRIDLPAEGLFEEKDGLLLINLNRVGRPVGFAFEAGAAYSSADRFTANGSVELVNAGLLPDNSRIAYPRFGLQGRYGPQVREILGNSVISLTAEDSQWGVGIELKGGYAENDRTALGGTDGQTAFSRRQGGQADANLSYDSFTAEERIAEAFGARDLSLLPLRFAGTLGLGMKLEDTEVARTSVGGLQSGTTAQLRINGSGSVIRLLRNPTEAGVGLVGFDLLANHQQGVDGVGGEFDYSRSEVGLAAELQFGFERSRDFLVREIVRVGVASGSLPTLEEFRIGGGSAVRGLQEGELSGRSVVTLAGEFGVNLGFITGVHRGKPGDEEQPKSFWARLDGVYLKGFLDWGRVTSDSGFQGAGRDSAFGTGLMLELPRELLGGGGSKAVPSLSLGYAYSPDSRIHRGGMFVVSTSLPF